MSRRGVATVLVLAMTAGVAGCRGGQEDASTEAANQATDTAVDRARAALKPFKRSLMNALQQGMAQGPDAAVAACHDEAPGLAAQANVAGVALGRTSDRLRNPANAARSWVKPLLAELKDAPPAEGLHRVVSLGERRFGYVEPIRVQPLCLACHGAEPAGPVQAKLAALYPKDAATGYAEGDFRGLFWVEVDLDAAQPAKGQ